MTQLYGVVVYGGVSFTAAMAIFGTLKATMGLRVEPEEEMEGLDLGEHGAHAYDLTLGGAGSGTPMQSTHAPMRMGAPVTVQG
jgi:Amt family ammonium transporter